MFQKLYGNGVLIAEGIILLFRLSHSKYYKLLSPTGLKSRGNCYVHNGVISARPSSTLVRDPLATQYWPH